MEDDFRPARKAHPGILVDDLDDLDDLDDAVRRLRTADQDVVWDGDLPGFRRAYSWPVRKPAGVPSAELGPTGPVAATHRTGGGDAPNR